MAPFDGLRVSGTRGKMERFFGHEIHETARKNEQILERFLF
jgi:hypothetical protein